MRGVVFMASAINVYVDKGCLRVIGEIPVASCKEELEAFVKNAAPDAYTRPLLDLLGRLP